MKKFVICVLAGIASWSSASAADLPSRRAPPVYIPPLIPLFSWTGFYVGGQVGAAFGQDRGVLDTTGLGLPAVIGRVPDLLIGQFPFGSSGIGTIGGAHIGFNYALPSFGAGFGTGLMIGVEGDVEGTDYRINNASPAFDVGGIVVPAGLVTNQIRQEIAGSARGRIGIAFDRALFFATGGAAFTQFHSRYAADLGTLGLGIGGTIGLGEYTHTRVGYTVGGGMEYAITTQFSLRGEYRYTDYGTFTDPVGAGLVAGFAGVPVTHREIQHRVEVGFSYKFDTVAAAPVVARY